MFAIFMLSYKTKPSMLNTIYIKNCSRWQHFNTNTIFYIETFFSRSLFQFDYITTNYVCMVDGSGNKSLLSNKKGEEIGFENTRYQQKNDIVCWLYILFCISFSGRQYLRVWEQLVSGVPRSAGSFYMRKFTTRCWIFLTFFCKSMHRDQIVKQSNNSQI